MKQQQPPRTLEEIREEILTTLTREAPNQLKSNELSKRLRIPATSPEYEMVRTALEELVDSGAIYRGARRNYGVAVPETIIEGRVRMVRQGQWCIVPTDGSGCEVEID